MATVKEREQERELLAKGFTVQVLKTWQPKLNMWRHAPGLNENGSVVHPIGTLIPNQPKAWDHQLRMSTRGILPWKPGQECIDLHKGGCTPCREALAHDNQQGNAETGFRGDFNSNNAANGVSMEFFRSPEPADLPEEVSVPEVPLLHSHQYKSRAMGAKCTHPACPAVRKAAFKKRNTKKSQAVVTIAEAAPNIG